jgi:hypothetical protein
MARKAVARKLSTFHATVHVTRTEEWFVEAASADEARELFAAGEGHRTSAGECLDIRLEKIHKD